MFIDFKDCDVYLDGKLLGHAKHLQLWQSPLNSKILQLILLDEHIYLEFYYYNQSRGILILKSISNKRWQLMQDKRAQDSKRFYKQLAELQIEE